MASKVRRMSIEQLESKLMELTPAQRREFARWFYDHEHEIVEAEDGAMATEMQIEVLRRRDELRARPGLAVPVTDEWFEQLKSRMRDARATQAPSR